MVSTIFSTAIIAFVAAAISGANAGGTSYPSCPDNQYTFGFCYENYKVTGGAATKYACNQMKANQKCNTNTNIYNAINCVSGSENIGETYCEASLIYSIDSNTFAGYCNDYLNQTPGAWANMAPGAYMTNDIGDSCLCTIFTLTPNDKSKRANPPFELSNSRIHAAKRQTPSYSDLTPEFNDAQILDQLCGNNNGKA